jgi:Mrp family chromosome partitioning ATPase
VTDAALLGTNADAVILVARAGVTDRNALHYALEQIRAVRAPLLGTVLNDVDARKDQYYGAYTSSSY